jgi:hypothetical protein
MKIARITTSLELFIVVDRLIFKEREKKEEDIDVILQ